MAATKTTVIVVRIKGPDGELISTERRYGLARRDPADLWSHEPLCERHPALPRRPGRYRVVCRENPSGPWRYCANFISHNGIFVFSPCITLVRRLGLRDGKWYSVRFERM